MKPKTVIPLIIGLGVGFFAIKMGIDMVQKAKNDQGGQIQVLVSAKTIDAATRITDTMLVAKPVAGSLIPEGAFKDQKSLQGRVTLMTIPAGTPITEAMLAPPGAEPGLAAKIPPGYVAASVALDEETGVAWLLRPGCRVNVYALGDHHAPRNRLILENIQVGAVGQEISEVAKDAKGAKPVISKTATLYLRPEQVAMLPPKGRVRLALLGVNGRDASGGENPGFWSSVVGGLLGGRGSAPDVNYHEVTIVLGSKVERRTYMNLGRPGKYQLVNLNAAPGGAEPAPPGALTE